MQGNGWPQGVQVHASTFLASSLALTLTMALILSLTLDGDDYYNLFLLLAIPISTLTIHRMAGECYEPDFKL